MKRGFLENLDLGDGAKLSSSAIDSIMAEYGKAETGFKTQIGTLEGQLRTANARLGDYDPEWKQKSETERQKLETAKFDFALERAVEASNPRNAKAVMALIDREKLKFTGGEVIGLDTQLDELKKGADTAFLFNDVRTKTGMSHQNSNPVGGDSKDDRRSAANDALRAVFGGKN